MPTFVPMPSPHWLRFTLMPPVGSMSSSSLAVAASRSAIRGAAVAVAPARVTFEMTSLAGLFAAQRNIALLQELLEEVSPSASAWSVTGLEKRDALIALDAHCNGASHREVAVMIFGSEKVDAEWIADGCDLKDYVRRRRSRGVRYMQGGYRHLLR